MGIKILATIGPSSLNKKVIEKMTDQGVSVFRINLSHTKLEDVEEGSYSFTEKAAMRASLIQQMGAKVTGMYQSGKSMYKS